MLFEVLSDNLISKHGRTKSSNIVAPRELRILDIVLQEKDVSYELGFAVWCLNAAA
jgi:hypothetical protein